MIHLLLGPVGAGKSTLAVRLAETHGAARFDLDHWMAVLYGEDERPADDRMAWYTERTDRALSLIWEHADELLRRGVPVVMELGLIRRADRQAFYARVDASDHGLRIYVLDAPREIRRERVQRRNEERGPTFDMVVPMAFFELASDLWEPPDEQERQTRDIVDM